MEILTLRQLCRHEKPIAVFNVAGYFDTLLAFMSEAVEKVFLKDIRNSLCESPRTENTFSKCSIVHTVFPPTVF